MVALCLTSTRTLSVHRVNVMLYCVELDLGVKSAKEGRLYLCD